MVNLIVSSVWDRVRASFGSNQWLWNWYVLGFYGKARSTKQIRAKTSWLGISIMCPSGATCLSVGCGFSELAMWKSNSACWSIIKRTSSSHDQNVTCSRHHIAEKLLIWGYATITHSLYRLYIYKLC